MYRKNELFWALALLLWILPSDGQAKKIVVIHSVECPLLGKVWSKVECEQISPIALTLNVTVGEKEAADNVVGMIDLKIYTQGHRKPMRLTKFKLDLCLLRNPIKSPSLLKEFYGVMYRAVNFPVICPFQRNTTYSMKGIQFEGPIPQYMPDANYTFNGKFYANNKLGFALKTTGGFYEMENVPQFNVST